MLELPTGTVTLLFTDIVGSTRLVRELGDRYAGLLAAHHGVLRAVWRAHGGREVDTQGDAFFVAFPRALDAVEAAIAAQRALAAHPWPEGGRVAVRMGLHTGEPRAVAWGYVGLDVNRAARIAAAGHGGQILLSQTTGDLVAPALPDGVRLAELGQHRLKDLVRPERLYQLLAPGLPAAFPALRTIDRHRHNLPVQPTPLIGREREVAAVRAMLGRAEIRLVTLLGPGGIGKTRLGLQVAAEALEDFADGVVFVPLAAVRDPELVAPAVAQAAGIAPAGDRPPLEALRDSLGDRRTLLLLDNFEQLLGAAPLVAKILAGCPAIKVLVTSRAALRLAGEHEVAVAPLPLPDPSGLPRPEEPRRLAESAAVQLFVDRARAVKADFALTASNAPAIAAICARLDGLPLAIELAAARVRVLPPQALLSRLAHRLDVLTGGARDLPDRQQTLRRAIDWSYELLDAGEQRLFRRLATFAGGATLEAVEAVCDADGALASGRPWAVDGVESLASKSLLRQVEGPDGEPRFAMLETIREYAAERLEESGEGETIRRAHAEYYLALGERARPYLTGPEGAVWQGRLGWEHDNLREALHWAVRQGEEELALRLVGVLGPFWESRGYFREPGR